MNTSIRLASNDVVLLTCPETFPASSILYEIEKKNFDDNEYFLIPCYSIPSYSQQEIEKLDCSDIKNILKQVNFYHKTVVNEGDDGWYSHYYYRPVLFYFAAAMKKKYFLEDIKGIDEDFRYGWGYEDTDFVRRIEKNNTKISWLKNGFCLHQFHYTNQDTTRNDDLRIEGWKRNKELFIKKGELI